MKTSADKTCVRILCLWFATGAAFAEEPPNPAQADAEHMGESKVDVELGDMITIAAGADSSASVRIGGGESQSPESRDVKVRIGKIYRQVSGSGASVCIQIPSTDDSLSCD